MQASISSLEKFKRACLEHCDFLVRELGFTVLPDPLEYNEYSVRFRKGTMGVDVYGEGYGTIADCKLRHGDTEVSVWTYAPIPARQPRMRRKKGSMPTQLEQIEGIAAALREHWMDFLAGDPTSFHQRLTAWTDYWNNQRATPAQLARKPFNVASTQAGHAFKNGEFSRVVDLLSPYAAVLGKKQRKMLETSLERAGSDSN